MQAWFSGPGPSPSLAAEWNFYVAARSAEEDGRGFGIDIEAATRSANETSSPAPSAWSLKVLRGLPGSSKSTKSSVPSGKSLMYFGIFLASGIFLVFIAFTIFLSVMVIMPQKFAICFTMGCAFIIGSFFALKGPKNQLYHMISKERLPFTVGFVGSMVATIYVSMVLHSYILSVFFSCLQVLALAYYAISYIPGGSAGMKFLSSALVSSVLRCFGRWAHPLVAHTHLFQPVFIAFYCIFVFAFDIEIVPIKDDRGASVPLSRYICNFTILLPNAPPVLKSLFSGLNFE